jgi:hypothetical protein
LPVLVEFSDDFGLSCKKVGEDVGVEEGFVHR